MYMTNKLPHYLYQSVVEVVVEERERKVRMYHSYTQPYL